jgi:hypothetical protein
LPPLNPGQFSWLKPVSGKNTAKKPATKTQRMHFNNRSNMADSPAMLKMYIRHCMQFCPSKGRHGLILNFLATIEPAWALPTGPDFAKIFKAQPMGAGKRRALFPLESIERISFNGKDFQQF